VQYCCGDTKKHDLINDTKITTELNERCEYIYTLIGLSRGGSTLGQRGGARAPQIQKLADRSDTTFEVPKCYKMQIFRTPLTALPQTTFGRGGGSLLPSQEPDPRSMPFGLRFYRSQGLTHYSIGNPTND